MADEKRDPGRVFGASGPRCRGRARRGMIATDMEISTIAEFGDATMDAEEDCWLLLADVTQRILARTAPRSAGPAGENVVAFPGRATERQDGAV